MPIYVGVNGQAQPINTARCSPDGTAKRVNKIYYGNENNRAIATWIRSGTPEKPHLIRTAADFRSISENPSDHYRLANDIIYASYPQVCTGENPFTGTLDGAGYTITTNSFHPTASYHDSVGLFGVNRGTITRLHVSATSLSQNTGIGGAIACTNYGTISSCKVSIWTGVYNKEGILGGVVGTNYGALRNIEGDFRTSYDLADKYGMVVGDNYGCVEYVFQKVSTFNGLNTDAKIDYNRVKIIAQRNISGQSNSSMQHCRWMAYFSYSANVPIFEGSGNASFMSDNKRVTKADGTLLSSYPGWDFNKVWKMGGVGPQLTFADVEV